MLLAALALPPEKKSELGEYGRQVIFDFYSVRRMAEDCLKVYNQVRRRRYNVVMSGYYGFSNAGDDAIPPVHTGGELWPPARISPSPSCPTTRR